MSAASGTRVPILVADDHPLFRSALISFLEGRPDIEVVGEAKNGEEAVEMVREHHPRVVIMDVHMPGLDGVEATRQILVEEPATRIVILTAGTDFGAAEAAMRAGAVAYVLKGREPEEIFDAILSATATW
jgi:DNA-binding NarL/FixJ family response regulator